VIKLKNIKKKNIWEIIEKDAFISNYNRLHGQIEEKKLIKVSEENIQGYLANFDIFISNKLVLENIKVQYYAKSDAYLYNKDHIISLADKLFITTQELFCHGFYEQSCISGRYTLERFLHDICSQIDNEEFIKYQEQIESNNKNPSLQKLMNSISNKHKWEPKFKKKMEIIKNNGDIYLHHRLEKIFENREEDDIRMGVVSCKFGVNGLQKIDDLHNQKVSFEINRYKRARKHALNSIRYLFELFAKYRPCNND